MSMNFAREQSLLRQRLQAKATPAHAEALRQRHGTAQIFLGAADHDVAAAATDLVAAHPQMGRAQMTAFARTLWNSKIHELRAVSAQLLAARAALLEPHDLPLLEGFLRDDASDQVLATLAGAVLGPLVHKNKKLWKDLKRHATGAHLGMQRAALRAAAAPVQAEPEAFARFVELAEPLLGEADPALQQAIDAALQSAAESSRAAAQEFVTRHARAVTLPPPRPVAAPPVANTKPPAKAKVAKKTTAKTAASGDAAQPRTASSAAKQVVQTATKPSGATKTARTKAPAGKRATGKKKT